MPKRSCLLTDARGNELKRAEFTTDGPSRFELTDVKPGLYTATFPEFGAEQLTVTGGNTFGAMRAPSDSWGFNPMRQTDQKDGDDVRAYFVVPAGQSSLVAQLADGEVSMGFFEGSVIAAEVLGKAKDSTRRFEFPPSDNPRVACLKVLRGTPGTIGLIVDGVTLYSPDPVSVLFETLK